MNPATLALIIGAIAEATKQGMQLAELLKEANAGQIDEATALARLEEMRPEYRAAREALEAAKAAGKEAVA
jgi:hypothetical protein